jgi:hypothetical protein
MSEDTEVVFHNERMFREEVIGICDQIKDEFL